MNITYKKSKPICKGLAVLQHQVSAVPNIDLLWILSITTLQSITKRNVKLLWT